MMRPRHFGQFRPLLSADHSAPGESSSKTNEKIGASATALSRTNQIADGSIDQSAEGPAYPALLSQGNLRRENPAEPGVLAGVELT